MHFRIRHEAVAEKKAKEKAERKAKLAAEGKNTTAIHTRSASKKDGLTLVASQLHRSAADEAFIAANNIKDIKTMSSSIKFCLIAEGKADIYPRYGTTMEWDTAAGHAI